MEGYCQRKDPQIVEKRCLIGSIQVIDSVHTVADVNIEKHEKRQKDGQPLA